MIRYSDIVLDHDPVAYWRMDDYSGNGSGMISQTMINSGTYVGTAGIVQSGAVLDDTEKYNGALFMYAQSPTYAQVPYSSSINDDSAFTIEFWLKKESIVDLNSGSQMILSSQSGSTGYFVNIQQSSSTQATIYVQIHAVPVAITVSLSELSSWVHCAFTWDGTNVKSYKNGVLIQTLSVSSAVYSPNTVNPLFVGCNQSLLQNLTGVLDEVAIYATALSQSQLATHYSARQIQSFEPEEESWLESTINSIEQYVKDTMKAKGNQNLYEIRMSFPSTNAELDFPLAKTVIAFEIDDVQNIPLGIGNSVLSSFYDDTALDVYEIESGMHELNIDISIWASHNSGGSTDRMRAYQFLADLFYGPRAYNQMLSKKGIEILSFKGGAFSRETMEEQDVFHVGGIELIVRVFSTNIPSQDEALAYIDEITQEPDLTL